MQTATVLGYELTEGQIEIVGAVLDPQVKRLSVCAMTRYGKTRSVAIGLLLVIMRSNELYGKPVKIILASPTKKQTNIIRNYISEHISGTPALIALVDNPGRGDPEHLKKEMSKERITFKNGCQLLTLTAHGKGEQLMGFGGDIIVLDEAGLIHDEVYTSRISRMLGDAPDSKLIELVNPWNKHNFAWRHWQNPEFRTIHIDWRKALREGRTTQTYIDEQQTELSKYEFDVLYESIFTDESEDTLIKWAWIDRAVKEPITLNDVGLRHVWGLDVAEQGKDLTILSKFLTDGYRYKMISIHVVKENETMPIANAVSAIVPKSELINVDSIGVGAGVFSRLRELGHNVYSVRVSMTATSETERYLNQKSQHYWRLRTLLETGMIQLLNNKHLKSQLSNMRYEFTSSGKIRIVDPEGKSPDYADSCMLGVIMQSEVPMVGN